MGFSRGLAEESIVLADDVSVNERALVEGRESRPRVYALCRVQKCDRVYYLELSASSRPVLSCQSLLGWSQIHTDRHMSRSRSRIEKASGTSQLYGGRAPRPAALG